MGYYLNEAEMPIQGKAEYLVQQHQAFILPDGIEEFDFQTIREGEALVCVVENPNFDAAALCSSQEEMEHFAQPDTLNKGNREEGSVQVFDLNPTEQRPRTWLLMPKEKAHQLSNYRG